MDLLAKLFNWFMGRFEQQTDLQIKNKTLVIYILSAFCFIGCLVPGAIDLYFKPDLITIVLLSSSFLSICNIFLLAYTRSYRKCGALIIALIGAVFLFLLFTGKTYFHSVWVILFPLVIMPLLGLKHISAVDRFNYCSPQLL